MKKIVISLVSVILIALVAAFAYIYINLNKIPKDDTISETMVVTNTKGEALKEDPNIVKQNSIPTTTNGLGVNIGADNKISKFPGNENVKNILLMGIDSENGVGRSDAIMVLSVDGNKKQIKMASIQRDSYVYIVGHGMTKLNHAHSYGGPPLALKTINSNFELNITDYASVNFSSLPSIVDTLGGVTVSISNAEAGQIGLAGAGTYRLNGRQALAYTRIRKIDTDYQRTSRQRTVLKALMSEMMSQSPTEFPRILNSLSPMIRTSLSNTEILSLGTQAGVGRYKMVDKMFPEESYAKGSMIGGVWYFVFDKPTMINNLLNFIYR